MIARRIEIGAQISTPTSLRRLSATTTTAATECTYVCILWCNTVTLLSQNGSLTFLWKRIRGLTNDPRIGRLAQASPQRTLLQQQQHFNGYSTIRVGREIISALQRCVLSVTTVALQHRQTLVGILILERALATSVDRAGQSEERGILNRRMVQRFRGSFRNDSATTKRDLLRN